jgi:hypothetical protein
MFDTPFAIPVIAIIGAFTYAIVQALSRARVRELEIRERIALIEKGLVPPPEVDPRGFETAMTRYDRAAALDGPGIRSAARHRRAGITLVGVGLGLCLLISVAGGETAQGVGVGGFIAVLGMAFLLNSVFELRQPSAPAAVAGGPTGSERPSGPAPTAD